MKADLCMSAIGVAEGDEWKTTWTGSDIYKARDAVELLTMGDILLLGAVEREGK
jgi:hypothetical protein